MASSVSPSRVGSSAPASAAAWAAVRNASGVTSGANLRAVRLLNGPLLIQKSFV